MTREIKAALTPEEWKNGKIYTNGQCPLFCEYRADLRMLSFGGGFGNEDKKTTSFCVPHELAGIIAFANACFDPRHDRKITHEKVNAIKHILDLQWPTPPREPMNTWQDVNAYVQSCELIAALESYLQSRPFERCKAQEHPFYCTREEGHYGPHALVQDDKPMQICKHCNAVMLEDDKGTFCAWCDTGRRKK